MRGANIVVPEGLGGLDRSTSQSLAQRKLIMTTDNWLPKHWEDWCKWLLGFWLCVSPWILHFDLDSKPTLTAVITGILLVFFERVTLFFYRAWEEWINGILGIWLVICPWILRIDIPMARDNFIAVGLLVIPLSFYEICLARRQ
jgi:hypothetical protein